VNAYEEILTIEAQMQKLLERVGAIRKEMAPEKPEKKRRKPTTKQRMEQMVDQYWAKKHLK
jgi:hypothetical protein